MRIGVISDTHNYFDPRIPELFAGADHILHAGDIGLPAIICCVSTAITVSFIKSGEAI